MAGDPIGKVSADATHDWGEWMDSLTCCARCGVIRRRDRGNKPCRGAVKVTLRAEALPNG